MPMNAFLLQDIPVDVAEYAGRVARSARRGMNEVLVEMLARAIALEEQVRAAAAAPAPTPAVAPANLRSESGATGTAASESPAATAESLVAPEPIAEAAAEAAAPTTAPPPPVEPAEVDDPESLTLREAMLAAQSIPSG